MDIIKKKSVLFLWVVIARWLIPEKIILNEIEFKYCEIEKSVWVDTVSNSQTLFKNFYIRL